MSTVNLRDYQVALKQRIREAWAAGAVNVMGVAPTASGKTTIFASILREHQGASVAIAHRQELVSQISLALARNEVQHSIIAPDNVIRNIISIQMAELGYSYYSPQAQCRVAGVDTLVRRDATDPWFRQVSLWVQDEGHHVQRENKWGRAAAMFPNARGLAVTATPQRADGRGLSRVNDGLMDALVQGPNMRDLMQQGYLSDYRIFVPAHTIDVAGVDISAGGDFSPEGLRSAVHKQRIVGDVVAHYLRLGGGKRGVTFTVDVESAVETAQAYRDAGVPAEVVSGKTPDAVRMSVLRDFASGKLLQLVNCDLFGEGFDLPAIEVVSFARPTWSLALYLQQFGRAMRIMEGKTLAVVIDHAGNVHRHGLPDAPRVWTLEARDRKSRNNSVVPLRVCPNCESAYERTEQVCPFCGTPYPPPTGRTLPSQVAGDLVELSPDVLAQLRGDIVHVDGPPRYPAGATEIVRAAIDKNHRLRQNAQHKLRAAIALWGGIGERTQDVRRAQVSFFVTFGIDVLSAQALGAKDADALRARIEKAIKWETK